ncbi:MBOAT family protein [Luteolibacter ambystomatis]|uniref:MBOAT family protein n=1 Tax=Luteolibacter ambystomatis TaxID=2824561 RepID=A0A975J024_9BACT|nr:MBOAT family protein [Luteolibacter ambystomatis]QUE51390.1 MBOAT family protein [Luteolibacter ambystomatis]
MLGGSPYWLVLLAGAIWASYVPARWREPGLALLAFSLVVGHAPVVAIVYLFAACLVWWLVRRESGLAAATVAVTTLAAGLVASKATEQYTHAGWISPLGLSYLVFRLIQFIVDARRGAWQRPPGFMEFIHFLFTPALFVAGPLERWDHWDKPVEESRGVRVSTGLWRIVIGLLKKMYVADLILPALAEHSGWVVPDAMGAHPGTADIWQACAYAYLKIYAEFSGYSDIAVGAALLWGHRPMENFNWPVIASTPADFWRRWHISIAQWCANCVYLPVMGLMRSVVVPMLASFIVMGLWHGLGWNRVAWALWQVGGLLVFITWQKRLGRPKTGTWRAGFGWKLASIAMTQTFVVASYVFMLHGETVPVLDSLALLGRMLGLNR